MADDQVVGDMVINLRGDAKELGRSTHDLADSLREVHRETEDSRSEFQRLHQQLTQLKMNPQMLTDMRQSIAHTKELREETERARKEMNQLLGVQSEGHGGGHFMQARMGAMMAHQAGSALGVAPLGQAAGMFMHLQHHMGSSMALQMAGGMLALEGFSMIHSKIVEMQKQLNEEHKKYNEELTKSVDHWREVASAQAPSNELSKLGFNEMVKAHEKRASLEEDTATANKEMSKTFSLTKVATGAEMIWNGSTSGSSFEQSQELKEHQIERERENEKEMKKLFVEQQDASLEHNGVLRGLQEQSAEIMSMAESPEKKRLEFEAKISEEREKLHHANEMREKMAGVAEEKAVRDATERVAQAEEARQQYMHKYKRKADRDPEVWRALETDIETKEGEAQAARQELERTKANAHKETQQSEASQDKIDQLNRNRNEREITEQHYQEMTKLRASAADAYVNLNERGYVKDLDLLRNKQQREAEERKHALNLLPEGSKERESLQRDQYSKQPLIDAKNAADTLEIFRKHNQEILGLGDERDKARTNLEMKGYEKRKQIEELEDAAKLRKFTESHQGDEEAISIFKSTQEMQRLSEQKEIDRDASEKLLNMDEQLRVTRHELSAENAHLAQMERELANAGKLNTDQIRDQVDAERKLMDTKERMSEFDKKQRTDVDINERLGRISHEDALRQRVNLEHPDWKDKPGLADQEVRRQLRDESSKFAHGELEKINPMIGFKEYLAQIKQALDQHILTPGQAGMLIGHKEQEMRPSVGESKQFSRQINFAAMHIGEVDPQHMMIRTQQDANKILEQIQKNTEAALRRQGIQ